ncbi:MAG: MmgE/PrpD family protein, partial [Pseudomonadota bacterium]
MTGLTESLAHFIENPGFETLPAEAARIVRNGFIDNVATMIAGRDEPVVRIVREFVAARKSGAREACVVFGEAMAASADAALINATAAHALDYDDVALGGHPSAVLVPAVLAEGEYLGATGADALRAYLVGYEVWAELWSREPDAYHVKGWHPTAVLGTIGATAAVAHLHRLSAGACQNALALAASMASGLVANFGTMTKPFHSGRAAACAIEAVRLTAGGL